MHRRFFLSVSLAMFGACTGEGTTTSDANDTSSTATSGAATDATSGAATDATSGAATDAATTDSETTDSETTTTATTTPPMTTTGTDETTTGDAAEYCHGFSLEAPAPFLELHVLGGELLLDGVTWPLECGVQGSWMFGLYPALGGWDPGTDSVMFTIEVDVDGFNDNPAGHFFSGEVWYYVGCEGVIGGVLGVAPVIPPDTLADLADLDGEEATVRVSVPADGQTLMAEATVTLQAPTELVQQGCMFGP